jgi:hypothetical protein
MEVLVRHERAMVLPETGDVNHDNRTCRCTLDRACRDVALLADTSVHDQEDRHVQHGQELASDTDHERTLAAEIVDEEESADHRRDELDDTKDCGCEKLLFVAVGSHHGEVFTAFTCQCLFIHFDVEMIVQLTQRRW